MHSPCLLVALCHVLSQAGAQFPQFKHFPTTGGATTDIRQRGGGIGPTRQLGNNAPTRQVKTEVYYVDTPEVRRPVNRNRGRTNARARSGSSGRNSPKKLDRERSRPSLNTAAGIRGDPSQTRETTQGVELDTVRRPFIPHFADEVEETFVFQQPVARGQVQPPSAFQQFQPSREQTRDQKPRFLQSSLSRPAPLERQQSLPSKAAPVFTQAASLSSNTIVPPQASAFELFQPRIEQNRAKQFTPPQTLQLRPTQAQQVQQFSAAEGQQFRPPQTKDVTATQRRQFTPPETTPLQLATLSQSRFVSAEKQQQRSFQPPPAQRQQQPLPAQAAPVFNQADSLFSNIIVSPQDGEQGGGVYFSYTAVLGN